MAVRNKNQHRSLYKCTILYCRENSNSSQHWSSAVCPYTVRQTSLHTCSTGSFFSISLFH